MFEKITLAEMVNNAIKGDDFTHIQAQTELFWEGEIYRTLVNL